MQDNQRRGQKRTSDEGYGNTSREPIILELSNLGQPLDQKYG